MHYWVAPHRQSIDTERKTASTDICVVHRASGALGAGASGGRSVRCLQSTSAWPKVPPMRFLSLTEHNIGVTGPLDAVLTHFDTLFTFRFTPHPIPNAHVQAVSPPHPSRDPSRESTATELGSLVCVNTSRCLSGYLWITIRTCVVQLHRGDRYRHSDVCANISNFKKRAGREGI